MNTIPKAESLMKSTKIKKRIAPENTGMVLRFYSSFENLLNEKRSLSSVSISSLELKGRE